MTTIVWNPSKEILPVSVKINEALISDVRVQPGEYKVIESAVPVNATDLKVSLSGSRTLVILQTSFN